jgi:hypothetical protein
MTSLEIYASSLFRNLKWSSLSSDWSQISQYNDLDFNFNFNFILFIVVDHRNFGKKKRKFPILIIPSECVEILAQ